MLSTFKSVIANLPPGVMILTIDPERKASGEARGYRYSVSYKGRRKQYAKSIAELREILSGITSE